eukprot:351467-Chlamydomonas_euryale.AAC.3
MSVVHAWDLHKQHNPMCSYKCMDGTVLPILKQPDHHESPDFLLTKNEMGTADELLNTWSSVNLLIEAHALRQPLREHTRHYPPAGPCNVLTANFKP